MTNGRRVRSTSLFLTMFCLLALQIGNLYAQEPIKTGTTAASFLELGVGSRAVAMGEAYVAIAEGPTAGYWNPAGLGMMRKISCDLHANGLRRRSGPAKRSNSHPYPPAYLRWARWQPTWQFRKIRSEP